MAKMSKEEIARRETMAYCLRIVKERGVEGLEKEIEMRNITNCPLGISKTDMDKFVDNVKLNTLDTVLILAACTLQDEFNFGRKRIERFIKRFEEKASVIADSYAEWGDFQEQLRYELKIELRIRANERDIIIGEKIKGDK